MISESTPSTLSCVGGTACEPKKHSRMRVQRAGADVAVDDAEGGERQRKQAVAGTMHGASCQGADDADRTTVGHRTSNRRRRLADGLELGAPLPAFDDWIRPGEHHARVGSRRIVSSVD